jgi:hypothetical protein
MVSCTVSETTPRSNVSFQQNNRSESRVRQSIYVGAV